MLTFVEKEKLRNIAPQLSKKFTENEEAELLIQLLSTYIEKANSGGYMPSHRDKRNREQCLEEIFSYMAEVAVADDEPRKHYTTGELSTYFGVSITTINNWVNEGRFIGVGRRKQHEQLKISDDVKWKSRSGEMFSVLEIVEEWEEGQRAIGMNLQDVDEKLFLQNQISLYEKKYAGMYEITLGQKEDWTAEEQTDAASWNYFRKKLGSL